MFFNPRKLFYSNAIEFPSTKTAGALTLLSEEFELANTDRTHIVLSALDASKITNTLTVYAKGSFDSGTTWMTLGTYTDLANGAGAISVKKIVPYAPLVKVEAVFSSSGALASGHGIKIDVVMEEGEDGLNKDFFEDVITLPAGSIESAYFDTTLTLGAKETASFSITGLPTSNGSVSIDGNNVAVYNSDVAEVVTAIITGGATADGNIGIVLPSLAQVDIAVQGGDTAADVATKLRGGAYDGWTAGGADTTVTFTKDVAGAVAGGAGMFVGDTGVTGSITSTTAGGDTDTLASIATKFAAVAYTNWDCTSNDVLVEFIGKANGPLTDIVFNAGATGMTISEITKVDGIADPTAGTLVIAGENVAVVEDDLVSLSALLAKIAAHPYTNWTVETASPRLTFTAKTLEDITDLTVDVGDTTGIDFSAVTTTGGIALGDNETVYGDTLDVSGFRKISKVKVVATAVPANVNDTTLYVQGSLDGLNWYDVLPTTTAIDATTVSFETTGYVGLHARVCLHTAETTGSLEAGHNIVASAVLDY